MFRPITLSLILASFLVTQPRFSQEVSCPGGYSLPPEKPRLETTLKIDLSYNEAEMPASLEFLILPADEKATLVGQTSPYQFQISAQYLTEGDWIWMESGKRTGFNPGIWDRLLERGKSNRDRKFPEGHST